MSKICIQLFGGTAVLTPEGQELSALGRKSASLLSILALSPNFVCTRESLLGILWGSRPQQQAQASLRQALSEARKALNSDHFAPLVTDRTNVKLAEEFVEVDALHCTALLNSDDQCRRAEAAVIIEKKFAPYQSINDEYYDVWMSQKYGRLKENYQRNLADSMREAFSQKDFQHTQTFARALLAIERGDEEAHRVLMQMYADQGNRTLALRQYETCCEALQMEYDAEPDVTTKELFETIKNSGALSAMPDLETSPPIAASGGVKQQITVSAGIPSVDDNDVEAGRLATEFIERLLGALSCFRWIDISRARHASEHSIAGRPRTSTAELPSADYIIQCHARRGARRLYISLDMVEFTSENIAFSKNFDADLTDEGFIPELLIHQVAGRSEERLRTSIVRAALQKPNSSLSALECALLALYGVQNMTLHSYDEANKLFNMAESKSPAFAFQYSCKALWMIFCYGQGWKRVRREEIYDLAKRATFLDPEDATSLAISGHMEVFCFKRFDVAADLFTRAITCNPHSPFVWTMRAVYFAYSGDAAAARQDLEWSHKISNAESHFRFMTSSAHCIVSLIGRDFEDAARWGRMMAGSNPGFSNGVKQLLVALGHLGLTGEAGQYVEQLAHLEPEFSSRSFVESYPLKRLEDRELFLEGLLLAGAPP